MSDSTNKLRLVFFVKKNLDNFLPDIIEELKEDYEVKKIIVTEYHQIDEEIKWADICWFEWCDELVIYASKLDIALEKYIICRLHSYEAFTHYPSLVNFNAVDKLIVVADFIKENISKKIDFDKDKIVVIPNGINLDKYTFVNKTDGYDIAYVGYINHKKGPMLLLHTFKKIFDIDNRYKLHIAGLFQEERYVLYFNQMIEEMGLANNIFYDGWIDNLNEWLEDKNYVLCTSVLESQNISVMQAMAKGTKPIVHNFVGAREIYDDKYIFNTIDEAVELITNQDYDSYEYRNFIETNYSLIKQISATKDEIKITMKEAINKQKFNYIDYWDKRYLSNGTSGLGSYGVLAEFKADIINEYIKQKGIKSAVEFGCGDGSQLSKINYDSYIGLDVSRVCINKCKLIFRKYENKKFYVYKPGEMSQDIKDVNNDMIVCLDVLYHITNEEDFIKTLDDIFMLNCPYIMIYTMLTEPKAPLSIHLKYRNVFEYLSKYPNYTQLSIVNQKYPNESYSDFLVVEKQEEVFGINSMQDMVRMINDFSLNLQVVINNYDFSSVSLLAGKKEKVNDKYYLVEYVLGNDKKAKLTIMGIMIDIIDNKIIYPNYIRSSINYEEINVLTNQIIDSTVFQDDNDLISFVLDNKIKEDIESNKLIYQWERAIPGTGFMPLNICLNIILRYKLASFFVTKKDNVLEAACGFGYGAAYLSNMCNKIEGLDISQENISFAKEAYPISNSNWIKGDVLKLPYNDNVFDVYISFETMEHLRVEDIDRYFQEAVRVIKQGGKFILSTPNSVNRKSINNPFHIKEYNFYEFDSLLKKYFKNISYYSQDKYKIVKGISNVTGIMIAVCELV